jgi:hypothetical protein
MLYAGAGGRAQKTHFCAAANFHIKDCYHAFYTGTGTRPAGNKIIRR